LFVTGIPFLFYMSFISRFFINLRLKVKLLIAFGSLVLLTVLIVAVFFYTLSKISTYEKASEEVDGLNIDVLEMDGAMRHFIFEGYKTDSFQVKGKSQFLNSYALHRDLVGSHVVALEKLTIAASYLKTDSIRSKLKEVNVYSDQITQLFKERGFKDYGLEGALRKAIHEVENSSYPYDKVEMLMLRRHEKDFFLRKDLKYQKEFNGRIEKFFTKITVASVKDGKSDILNNIANYQRQFNAVVDIEIKIGLKENDGIKGQINRELSTLKKSITGLRSTIKVASNEFESRATTGLLVLFIVQVIFGIALAIAYSNVITRAIKELQQAMQKLAEGHFPDFLLVRSTEEIGKTKSAFNQLLERMKVATDFATAVGQGNLHAKYSGQFSNDILAQSMIRMQEQLEEANAKQHVINWTTTGVAQLNDILKNDSADVKTIGNLILATLANYLNANQGALYLLQETESKEILEVISTYASTKEKLKEQRIEIGEGLVGQCYLDKAPIILTEVPKTYIKITSGLGETIPRFLILMPLLIQGKVMGVLELASLKLFKEYEIDFLKRVSENIAALLSNRKSTAETVRLLNDAREQAQLLSSQAEEIQQNAEEMQAIQDQMSRDKKELENEVDALKAKLANQYSNA
jgi:methyl-accepting chemotaxis protein